MNSSGVCVFCAVLSVLPVLTINRQESVIVSRPRYSYILHVQRHCAPHSAPHTIPNLTQTKIAYTLEPSFRGPVRQGKGKARHTAGTAHSKRGPSYSVMPCYNYMWTQACVYVAFFFFKYIHNRSTGDVIIIK